MEVIPSWFLGQDIAQFLMLDMAADMCKGSSPSSTMASFIKHGYDVMRKQIQ